MTKRNLASALSFAHLAGVTSAKAEDDKDDDKKKDDAPAAEEKEGEQDEEEGEDKDKKDGKKSKKASEEDDEEEEMSASDDKEDDCDGKEGKKAAAKKATLAERSRCAKIIGARAAARNLPLACHLAFNTDMTANAAIAALSDASVAAMPTRHNPNLGPNGGSAPDSRQALTNSWDRAFAKTSRK